MKKQIVDEAAMLAYGQQLAKSIKPGTTLLVSGDLGAGKTVLARGIAQGLGIITPITSPTFVLIKTYPIKKHPHIKQFIHADLYRLSDPAAIADLGLQDLLAQPGTVGLIEWGEQVPNDLLNTPIKKLSIALNQDGTRTVINNY